MATPPIVTVIPLNVPIPRLARFRVNVVPVPPAGIFVPLVICIPNDKFGGENVIL